MLDKLSFRSRLECIILEKGEGLEVLVCFVLDWIVFKIVEWRVVIRWLVILVKIVNLLEGF